MLMHQEYATCGKMTRQSAVLRVYLLGQVEFEAALTLQRMLAFEAAGERSSASLLMCEHPPVITVGRDGSPADLRCDLDELRTRRWPIRWVNRGGGSLLHLPGQLAIYPIMPLDWLGLGLADYVDRLQRVLIAVLDDFGTRGITRPGQPGVWVGQRLIAGVGVAVRDWVAYFGAVLNVNPDLFPFRILRSAPDEREPMTSLARERRGPPRAALVRQRFLDHFAARFGFERLSLFFHHAALDLSVRARSASANR